MTVTRDPYRYQAKAWRTSKQWAKWENVGLAPTLDLTDLVLNWTDARVIDLEARGAITSVELERTIEGASTLTIVLRDPGQRLFSQWARRMRPRQLTVKQKRRPVEVDEGWDPIMSPDLIGKAMQVELDGAIFRLVGAAYQHQTEEVTLTFEDRIVYLLRRKRGERRASRSKVTRAQFILSLLREVQLTKPPFICPDLSVKQPIDKADSDGSSSRALPRQSTAALRVADAPLTAPSTPGEAGGQGISAGADLTIKGAKATPQQKRVGQQILDTCSQVGAEPRPTKACMCACIIESQVQNLTGGDRDSRGVLQVRDSTAGPMGIDNRNVPECVTAFLKKGFWGKGGAIQIAQKNPGMSVGTVAQNTQGSAFPDRYDQVAGEAQKWIDAYGGGNLGAGGSEGGSYTKSYQYARESDENSWDAIQRLADEVGWRFFVVGEAVYYMSEDALYRRRPRYEITADSELLIDLQYDVDWGKSVSEATLVVALDRWGAPPGAVMVLKGLGPPDGRWLITSVRRDWFSPTAEVTIKQPSKAKLEPAAERVQRSAAAGDGADIGSADSSASGRAYAEAKRISDQKLNYIWGGGHGAAGTPSGAGGGPKDSGPGPGFDCSGYVCAILAAAGMGFKPGGPVMTSGALMGWGQSGPGERVTVWANGGHTFIEFTGLGSGRFADTGRNAAPPQDRGPRLRSGTRSTAGFTARHWPGC
jgi:hypothetical protein